METFEVHETWRVCDDMQQRAMFESNRGHCSDLSRSTWVIHKLTHLHEKYINTKDLWFRSLCYFHNLHEKVGVEKGESIQKHYNTQDSSWNKQLGVPAQPQVVKSHLLSKVAPVEQRRNTGADMDFKF